MNDQVQFSGSAAEKKYKTIIVIMALIIIGLIIALFMTNQRKSVQIEQKLTENVGLQSELDSLMKEHEFIKLEYGALTDSLSTKDSLIQANADEIKKLIASQADYYRIRKKLDLLRKTTQGYLNQIDSLYTANRLLKEENVVLTEKFERQVSRSMELEKDKEILEEKVTQAAILKAYNISAMGARIRGEDNEKITFKARRVDAVKVCFTLSENPIIEKGPKTIYVRVARPDNVIVTRGKDDAFTFEYQGEKINFTMKETIDYQNKAMDLCLYWHKQTDEPAMKGTYHVSIFADGYEIGYTTFVLE